MIVLVMIPVFRLINCDQIVSIMIYLFSNIYTFPGLSNDLNCMDYEFFQHYASCLDSIYVLLVVTNIYFVPLFFADLYFSHSFVLVFLEVSALVIGYLFLQPCCPCGSPVGLFQSLCSLLKGSPKFLEGLLRKCEQFPGKYSL